MTSSLPSRRVEFPKEISANSFPSLIDQFRYIKIQPKTIDLSTRPMGITTEFVGFIPKLEPRIEVCCLNFNISKLVYPLGF